ncbi:hypothetical protein ACTHSI_20365, partial [Neisseria sp. P0001.S004]
MQVTVKAVKPGFEVFKAVDTVVKQSLLALTVDNSGSVKGILRYIQTNSVSHNFPYYADSHFCVFFDATQFSDNKKTPSSSFLQSDDL